MKKVCSFKKKLVAFGLAVCTFVTSTGVNECSAAGNTAPQNQNQQEEQDDFTASDMIWVVVLIAVCGVNAAVIRYPECVEIVVSKILNALWLAIKHYKISGGIALATIIGIMINKLKNFPKTLTDGINDAKSKRNKLDAEKNKLEEDMQKLKEKLAKNKKESWEAFGEELNSAPKKIGTLFLTAVSGLWTCATIVLKLTALGAKNLYNLLCWIENGCVPVWHKYF